MCAHEHHTQHELRAGRTVTWSGMAVNVVLIAMKIFGGIFGSSKALLADAAHSASDFVSDVLILIGLHFFHKEEDAEHPYGHGKIETLATLGVGALLLAAAARIGIEAALVIHRGDITAPRSFTILIAAISIVSKEILYHATVRIGKRLRSEAVIANAWHHRSDAWSSAVALVGISLAVYVPALQVLDSYAALLVSFFIVKIGIDIMGGAIRKIIDTSPPHELIEEIRAEIQTVSGVKGCHDITGRYYADMIRMEAHVEVDPALSVLESHRIADEVTSRVRERFEDVSHILVHIDPYPEAAASGSATVRRDEV